MKDQALGPAPTRDSNVAVVAIVAMVVIGTIALVAVKPDDAKSVVLCVTLISVAAMGVFGVARLLAKLL